MKIIFASDIHGSSYYCKKLLDIVETTGPDKLVLLGDLLYHGARNDLTKEYNTNDVANLLNSVADKIICVRGNCDSEVDQAVLSFPIMSDYLAMYLCDKSIMITHGHRDFSMHSYDIKISGHTHIPIMKTQDGKLYMNPGSISLPRGGNHNTYMRYEDGVFEIKTLAGEVVHSIQI